LGSRDHAGLQSGLATRLLGHPRPGQPRLGRRTSETRKWPPARPRPRRAARKGGRLAAPNQRNHGMTHANGNHTNVDPAEISKFDALASRWWDPDGEFRPLHEMNPVRLAWIDERSGGLAGLRALDVGCGGGILA